MIGWLGASQPARTNHHRVDMKTLLILRHAKSSWDAPGLTDHDRPLNARGKRDAPRVGQLIYDEGLVPDLIVCSTAKRARKTAKKVARSSGYRGTIQETDILYHGEPKDWILLLRELADTHQRVMIVGHNPGLEDLLALLTGQYERLTTANLAVLQLPIDSWEDLDPRNQQATIAKLWRPADA